MSKQTIFLILKAINEHSSTFNFVEYQYFNTLGIIMKRRIQLYYYGACA